MNDQVEGNPGNCPMLPIPTGVQPHGRLSRRPKAILFDVYGTLFISGSGDISIAEKKSGNAEKLNGLFQKFGIRLPVKKILHNFFSRIEEEHIRMKSNGVDFPEVRIEEIWGSVLGITDAEILTQFAREYEATVNPVCPMPNAEKIFHHCRSRHLLMGIISNAQFYTAELFSVFFKTDLPSLGFDPDLLFYSFVFGYAKPSSFLFQKAAAALEQKQIAPASVLYIGNDMLNDIYPARNAGFQTALFAGDIRSLRMREEDERCAGLKPDIIITDLKQLIHHMV